MSQILVGISLNFIRLYFYRFLFISACFLDENGTEILPCFKSGVEVLQQRGLSTNEETFLVNIVCLLAIMIVFTALTYLFIRRFVRRSGYY